MRLISLFVLSLLSLNLIAQNISIIDAEQIAIKFLEEKKATYNMNDTHKYDASNSYSFQETDQQFYHVINFLPTGFVIVSGTQKISPILGYSYNNTCLQNDQNSEFSWWMSQVVDQIKFIDKHDLKCDASVNNLWQHYLNEPANLNRYSSTNSLEPMLTTKWNQSPYYNAMCPADPAGPNGKCLSGCVATALGQLMNYYRHPQQGVGEYTYEHPTYGTQSVNFGEQTYYWDAMATRLNDYNPEIAKLLYHIGVSVDMDYGPNGSGMYNHKGAYTLKTYFDYSEDTRYYFRDSLAADFNWKDTLTMQLDQGMPTYYAGWGDTIFQMGHAFIVDGYQDTSFFHFNWGWGGSADGYFNIDNLTPGGSDFTLLHEMIAYSYPKSNYPSQCEGLKTLTTKRGTIEDGSGPLNLYSDNQACSWLIAPTDSVSSITLDFIKFDLSENDILTIYEGLDDNASVLASYSGEDLPSSLTATSDRLYLTFTTDATETASGFLVKYSTEKPTLCSSYYNFQYEPFGTFNDGSNSYNYNNETSCRWKIQPENTDNILISFDYLDTESINDCIIIKDMANNIFIDTISGHVIPDPILIYSNEVKIYWKTNESINLNGWQISYETNTVSVSEMSKSSFSVFPNPCSSIINIKCDPSTKYQVNLRDFSGRILYSGKIFNQSRTIKIDEYSKGMYFIELLNENERMIQKIIID